MQYETAELSPKVDGPVCISSSNESELLFHTFSSTWGCHFGIWAFLIDLQWQLVEICNPLMPTILNIYACVHSPSVDLFCCGVCSVLCLHFDWVVCFLLLDFNSSLNFVDEILYHMFCRHFLCGFFSFLCLSQSRNTHFIKVHFVIFFLASCF